MRHHFARLALGFAALAAGSVFPARAGLIGYYTFDGNANDSSGHGNNGTLSANAPTLTAPGGGYTGWNNPNSQAYQFGAGSSNPADPLNAFITVPININPTALPQLTFGAWIKSDDVSAVTRGIISQDNGGFDRTLDSDIRLDGIARFCAFTGSAAGNGICGGPVTTDWTFVALRFDAAAGLGQMTIDGGSSAPYAVANGSGTTTTAIGRNPNFDQPFSGLIDNVFFFDTYISDAQMADLYRNGYQSGPAPVPEPSTLGLVAGGVALLFFRRRR
jgi:hypothetical protein